MNNKIITDLRINTKGLYKTSLWCYYGNINDDITNTKTVIEESLLKYDYETMIINSFLNIYI